MNLRFIAILLLSLTGFHSGLCQFSWMLEFKPDGYYSGAESLSIDTDNNVVVVGNFNEGITLAENHYTGFGSFVIKLTSNGVPLWHKIIRSSLPEFASVSHIHIDQYNNIYIGGGYSGTVTIDNSQLSSGYPYNSFVAKLDTDGQVIWQKNIPNVQEIFDMKGNIHGDILLYSLHFGTVVIDNIQAEVGPNSFGVLLNASGEVQWIKPFGERLQYTTWPKACAIDETGNTYFHGIFSGTLQADGKQVTSTGGNYDFFFARVNPSGTCDWLRSAERKISQFETSTPPSGLIVERGAIAVDDSGNLYGGGNFWEGIKLGSLNLSGSGQFVLKLKNDGTPEWIKRKTNSNNSTVDDIIVKNNKVYIGGILPSQVYIDVYTSGGDVVEAISVPVFADIASGLGVDTYDSIYFSGRRYDNDKLTAFVFKYGAKAILPLPQPAGDITEPMVFCPPDATLLVKTSAIGGASSYEWEITFNNAIITLVSDNSEIEIVTEDLGITGDFSVRVRGHNEAGFGQYSIMHTLKAETPLQAPELFASCNTVFTKEDNQSVQWYLNDQALSGFENKTSVQPVGNGNYYITISNTCGVVKSNEIDFQPLMPESIFMPNIITPNDDDINEYLILDEKLESPRLTVFNRWGDIIYSAEAYMDQWDGTNVPSGVYFYQVHSACLPKPIQGTLTIIK